MFERMTDRARRVVVLGQEEARQLNHNYIGTEHLLLGLIREGEGVAARALTFLGVDLATVRDAVLTRVGQGEAAPTGHISFTPRTKKVLELSLREALQLGCNYVGTEHLLLALIREGESVAAQVLVQGGLSLDVMRKQVIEILAGYTSPVKTGCMKLQVDRYVNGDDEVTIRFKVPRGTFKGTRTEAIAAEVKDFIANNEWAQGCVSHHHPTTFTGIVRTVTKLPDTG